MGADKNGRSTQNDQKHCQQPDIVISDSSGKAGEIVTSPGHEKVQISLIPAESESGGQYQQSNTVKQQGEFPMVPPEQNGPY